MVPDPERPLVYWRLVAGPESTLVFTVDRRPVVGMWTADHGGQMRAGDVVFVYGTKRLQAYVAVGRVCSDPRQNDRAQRLKKNRAWWLYVQLQPLKTTVPRAEIEALPFARSDRSGLKTPAGASANRVSFEAAAGMVEVLRPGSPKAANRLEGWMAGRGAYPPDLDSEELRWAEWERPEVSSPEERRLSANIADRLVRTGRFRYLTTDDIDVRSRRNTQKTAISLEHPIQDIAGRGYVDILLVDLASNSPATLLAIEVKIRAGLAPPRNPVPQIIRYHNALTETVGERWAIDTLIVAEHFDDAVLREADIRHIPHRTCSRRTGRLTEAL